MKSTFLRYLLLMITFSTVFADLPKNLVSGDHPDFFWSGRIIKHDQMVSMNWPGVQMQTQFTGKSLSLKFEGKSVWEVEIDRQDPVKIKVGENVEWFTLTESLSDKIHHLKMTKVSENQGNTVQFIALGLATQGEIKPLYKVPDRRIEFIGDSYTVGFGNESPFRDPPPGQEDSLVFYTTNSSLSFGGILAKTFGADYQINAFSGRGLVKNYNGIDPGKEFLYYYRQTLFPPQHEGPLKATWDLSSWHPQVIVITLGINDFQQNNNTTDSLPFLKAYREFLQELRTAHPKVKFILCATTTYPEDRLKGIVQEVIAQENRAGNKDLHYFEFGAERTGLYWHPSLRDHQNIAYQLQGLVARLGGWLSR